MRYYILDDDINVVKILSNIIEENFKWTVVGHSVNPVTALDDIAVIKPDILIVDYLMPELDGVDIINRTKVLLPTLEYVMISQVSDKEMIATAYEEGLSVFISKPINKIEVNSVLKMVEDKILTARKLGQIVDLIGGPQVASKKDNGPVITSILKELGIYSEKGSKDILAIVSLKNQRDLDLEEALKLYCDQNNEKAKSVRQRVRRAITRGLKNIAYLGMEDYLNDKFVKYSNSLYDFESVKKEMDYIRGSTTSKGSVSVDKFMENLCEF
jgi:two-component system response regulator YcbB